MNIRTIQTAVVIRRASAALILLSAGVALAVGNAPLNAEQVLRKGNAVEPESLDPHKSEGTGAANILRDVYEGLTSEAPDATVIPGAAERWTISKDLRVYTFHLRPTARWSNGDPVTAADFVTGLQRSVAPATGSNYSQVLAPIENAEAIIAGELPVSDLGAKALDAHTLEIRLRGPTPYFLGLLNHSSTYPIHRASLKAHGESFARPGKLVGNGAYQLTEWVVQSHVTLERNPNYWDAENVAIAKVIYYPTENLGSEFKRFRAGELDWTDEIPLNQAKWIRENLAEPFHVAVYLGTYYYGFNLKQPPFAGKPGLRRALAMVIDREVLCEKIIGTGEQPAHGWIPPGISGYTTQDPPWAAWPMERRLAEARRLYAEAGYSEDNPLKFELLYNTEENHKKIAITIAYMWKKALGAQAQLVNQEWKVYLQRRRHGADTQVFRAGWIGDYNDAYTFSELMDSRNDLNDFFYANPAYDALLDQASVEGDAEKRRSYLEAAERLLLEDQPIIPIYFYVTKRLVSPRLKGWQPNVMDHHYTRHFWLEPN